MEFYRRKFFQVKIENPGHFAYHNQDEKSSLHRQGAQTRTWRVTVISTFADLCSRLQQRPFMRGQE